MQRRGFYFFCGRRGQNPADLGSGDGVLKAAGMQPGSMMQSAPLGMGAGSIKGTGFMS